MKTKTLSSLLLVIVACLETNSAFAAPSQEIAKLIKTPATAFDVFLYRLYQESNGPGFFGGPNMGESLRAIDVRYDIDSNTVEMSFHILANHKYLDGFLGRDLQGKKEQMLAAARILADSLGIESRDAGKGFRYGLIQSTPVRNGWGTKDIDERKFKDEVADRTVLELIHADDPRLVYKVKRTIRGTYEFSVDTK